MSDNLPAQFAPQEIELFEEWEAPALLDWLKRAAEELSHVEQWTETARLNVGHALVLLREQLADGLYGKAENELAKSAGVSKRTLARWRKAYQDAKVLTASPRSKAQTKRREDEKDDPLMTPVISEPEPIEATAEQIPNAHLLVNLEDERPPSTGHATKPQPAPPTPAPTQDSRVASRDSDPLAWIVAQQPATLAERYDAATLRSAGRRLLKAAEQQASAPSSDGACEHSNENKLTYGVFCADCKARLR